MRAWVTHLIVARLQTSNDERKRRVHEIIAELGLRHVTHSQIGGSGHVRGISGGR